MSNCKMQLAITMQSPQCKKDRTGPSYVIPGVKYICCTKLVDQGKVAVWLSALLAWAAASFV